jgi:hypothetical protein
MTCQVCGGSLDGPPLGPDGGAGAPGAHPAPGGLSSIDSLAGLAPAGAELHASCFARSLPGDLLAVFTTVAAMVLAPMIVVWGG